MLRSAIVFGIFLLSCTLFDFDSAIKHRDRIGNRHEHESLLDKQERERNEKDRRKDDSSNKEVTRNITCYKCDGDQCRDPFKNQDSIPVVQCEHSCWKGVFAGSVRRSCGNKRCTVTFQGSTAISHTCCQTSFCNGGPTKSLSFIALIIPFMIIC